MVFNNATLLVALLAAGERDQLCALHPHCSGAASPSSPWWGNWDVDGLWTGFSSYIGTCPYGTPMGLSDERPGTLHFCKRIKESCKGISSLVFPLTCLFKIKKADKTSMRGVIWVSCNSVFPQDLVHALVTSYSRSLPPWKSSQNVKDWFKLVHEIKQLL